VSSARRELHVLAGDIGGTRARFALVDASGRRVRKMDVFPSKEHRTFEHALERFVSELPPRTRIAAATFGIAGPVVDQRVKTTNLPWTIDARSVSRALGGAPVTLLNDLVAMGLGAMAATPAKLAVLRLGRPKKTAGNIAVIAAGTGLGEASFVWDGERHVPCPNEGGHSDFAPRSALEVELFEKLAAEHGHVSYERIASGSSIHWLYDFFVRDKNMRDTKENLAAIAAAPDKNVVIVDLAERGTSAPAMCAIDLWASVYGAEAGNLALKCLASAGVYVCGGASARLASILAKGLPAHRNGGEPTSPFLEAFLDKGRMRPLLERIPIAVLKEPLAGLMGAASHAAAAVTRRRSPSVARARRA
jgi:glucokinase